MLSQFYQKSANPASSKPQAAKGLQRLDTILSGMGYVVSGSAIGYIALGTPSSTEGGET